MNRTKQVLISVAFFLAAIHTNAQSQNQAFSEFKKKNTLISNVSYSVSCDSILHYLQDDNKNRTYLLWIYPGDTLVIPEKKDLPEGFSFSTVHYFSTVNFTFSPKKGWNVMSDHLGNTYIRVH
jgi:hypothetical protein